MPQAQDRTEAQREPTIEEMRAKLDAALAELAAAQKAHNRMAGQVRDPEGRESGGRLHRIGLELQDSGKVISDELSGLADDMKSYAIAQGARARDGVVSGVQRAGQAVSDRAHAVDQYIDGKLDAADAWMDDKADQINQWGKDTYSSANKWVNTKVDSVQQKADRIRQDFAERRGSLAEKIKKFGEVTKKFGATVKSFAERQGSRVTEGVKQFGRDAKVAADYTMLQGRVGAMMVADGVSRAADNAVQQGRAGYTVAKEKAGRAADSVKQAADALNYPKQFAELRKENAELRAMIGQLSDHVLPDTVGRAGSYEKPRDLSSVTSKSAAQAAAFNGTQNATQAVRDSVAAAAGSDQAGFKPRNVGGPAKDDLGR